MDNAMMKAYNAWPNRVYIVGGDGVVFYRGPWGPRGISSARFEESLDRLLSLEGGGRFTDLAPDLDLLAGKPVRAGGLELPEGFEPVDRTEGFLVRHRRKPGSRFEIDIPDALSAARDFLRAAGLLDDPARGETVREAELVAVAEDGRESRSKRSSLYRLRYHHVVQNVPLSGERLDLLLDESGVLEMGGTWHRLRRLEGGDEGKRSSSLEAAKHAGKMKAVARLAYVRREDESGEIRFHPVFRIGEGSKPVEVDLRR